MPDTAGLGRAGLSRNTLGDDLSLQKLGLRAGTGRACRSEVGRQGPPPGSPVTAEGEVGIAGVWAHPLSKTQSDGLHASQLWAEHTPGG